MADTPLRADALAPPEPLRCPLCHTAALVTCTEGEPGHENHWLMCQACETTFEAAAPPRADALEAPQETEVQDTKEDTRGGSL